jgi:hypothetical protein
VQVVDAVAPLVYQQGWGLCVSWLDPVGEQVALVRLKPQVLVKVAVDEKEMNRERTQASENS